MAPTIHEPEALEHALWKIEQRHESIGADQVQEIIEWARALEAENSRLAQELAAAQRKG